jgi:DNA modification methylase
MRALRKQPLGNVLPFEKPSTFSVECIDNLEFMRTLKNDSMHLIVTSPPYNLGKTYEKRTSNGPVRDVVGILRGVISGNMIISY